MVLVSLFYHEHSNCQWYGQVLGLCQSQQPLGVVVTEQPLTYHEAPYFGDDGTSVDVSQYNLSTFGNLV
jgi:hypothetical protein